MKKKIMFITTVAVIIALAAAGTAFAANGYGEGVGEPLEATDGNGYGRTSERGTGQRFAVQSEMYETDEEFHQAVLNQKLEILDAKEADGSISKEEADALREYLTSCDGTCETEGENPNRPEDGWGVFGQSGQGQSNSGNGGKTMGTRGNGERLQSEDCDEEEPLRDGSKNEEGTGNRHGANR